MQNGVIKLNIFDDSKYGSKYVFHIGDIVGTILYIFRLNNIDEKEISNYLIAEYACLFSEKLGEAKIKSEVRILPEEKEGFLKFNKGLYKETENNGIVLTKDLSSTELQRRYLCMPYNVLEVALDDEIQTKIIETYNKERQKIYQKRTELQNILLKKD